MKTECVSVSEAIRDGAAFLLQHGIEDAAIDARLLMQGAGGYSQTQIVSNGRDLLHEETLVRYRKWLDRRANGEPVQRIIGYCEFYGRRFSCPSDVLIPRPDTETLIDVVLSTIGPKDRPVHILDIGTGSGVIAVTLAAELTKARLVAVDISEEALYVAKGNAEQAGVEDRVTCLQSNLFSHVEGAFDFIVSNPPYIPSGDIADLQGEVRLHDPGLALDGGTDGLVFYREIFGKAKQHLLAGGKIAVEIGYDQKALVMDIAVDSGFSALEEFSDLAGNDRVILAGLAN